MRDNNSKMKFFIKKTMKKEVKSLLFGGILTPKNEGNYLNHYRLTRIEGFDLIII